MMTPTHTPSPEWQNENALRAYPLTDDAKAASVLPTWLISDLKVTCTAEFDEIYVSSAYVSQTLVSVAISGRAGNGQPVGLLARTVTRDELEPYRAYSMDSLSGKAHGAVAFGEIPADAQPFKATFAPGEASIVDTAVTRVAAPGVTGIRDPYHDVLATGIVDFSGGNGFRTAVDPSDPQTIVVTLDDATRDATTSVCDASPSFQECNETPVRTINGVAPTTETTVIGGVAVPAGVIFINFR